jgi:DNA-binding response OmpR family regulator
LTDKSIFVVEDDALIALRNYELLTKSGYKVPQMFASGEDLPDHLEMSDPPDLILMDLGLSGKIDGIETARQIRERYNIPVIFLTAYIDDQRMIRAKEISPYGYIVKPVVERELIEMIGTALRETESCGHGS